MHQVERCLGRPAHVSHGRGDDVTWVYSARGGTVRLVFVFDKAGLLTRFSSYAGY